MKTPPLALLFLNFFFLSCHIFYKFSCRLGLLQIVSALNLTMLQMIWGLCLGGVDISGPLASSIWF